MIERTCVACNRKFKVLSTSNTECCSRYCMSKHTGNKKLDSAYVSFIHKSGFSNKKKPPSFEFINKKDEISEYSEELKEIDVDIEEMSEEIKYDPDKMWDSYVSKAKGLLGDIAQNRIDIAEIAILACDIRWGGDHDQSRVTVAKFAKDCGIHYKTLSNWMRIKRNVIDKLYEAKVEFRYADNWADFNRIADRCKSSATPEEVAKMFTKWKKDSPHGKELNQSRLVLQSMRKFKTFHSFLTKQADAKKLSYSDMKIMEGTLKEILMWTDKNKRAFKKG